MENNSSHEVSDEIINECKLLIEKIPSIISSKIVTTQTGEVTELHVLADMNRAPKQIVRDIQSALLAKYNLRLDHKVISIAQIDSGERPLKDFRLNLQNIQVLSEGAKAQAKVILSRDGEIFEGVAEGGNSTTSRNRLIVEATLDSIHSFLNLKYIFVLADVAKLSISGKTAFAVTISHISESGEDLLIGSSLVKQDESEAIIKATLDAINRRMVRYWYK